MKKMLLVIFILITAVTFGVQAQESEDTTTEIWRCFDLVDFGKSTVLIRLTRVTRYSEDVGVGEVSVAGVTYMALFQVTGLDRRWDFGSDEIPIYSFIIQPNGDGAYYDFSNVEAGGTTMPSQNFKCVST